MLEFWFLSGVGRAPLIDRLAAAVEHRSMAFPSRLPVLLAFTLLAACGAAPLKPPPAIEIPAAPPPARAAEDMDDVILAPTQPRPAKPSAKRPTALPGSPIRFEGGDGSSKEAAIVILGALGESDGVESEYRYLDMLHGPRPGGWNMLTQSLLGDQGKNYDALEIERSGKRETVYFDITAYFGKF